MTTILVPIDISPAAAAALPVARRMADEMHADIVLLSVGELPETGAQASEADAQNERIFSDAEAHFAGHTVRRRTEPAESPAHAIIRAAAEEHADMVVLGTNGGANAEVARDEVADEVVGAASVPVTLVRYQHP